MREKENLLNHRPERGVALLFALLALLLLSAVAAALMFMTTTETSVNYNYRSERVAYFGAKAGVEEVRDRMMAANPASVAALLPAAAPSSTGGVLYLLNEGNAPGSVQPWTQSNAYVDDELCHDGYTLPGLQSQSTVAPDIRCTSVPTGAAWYSTTTSNAPWNGTSAALAYKWVRITLKLNGSVQSYPANGSASATTQVCWNGVSEVLLQAPATTCQALVPVANPVYLITALGVSASGTRRMVQAEVALSPAPPFPYGLFATSNGCGAVTVSGGGATDSFTTQNGGTYSTTHVQTLGDVGSNGSVTLSGSSTQIGGSIGVPNATTGGCPPNGLTINGGAGMVGGQNPPNALQAAGPFTFTPPPVPNPLPPTTNKSFQGNGGSLVPGTYGNIKVTGGGTLTIAPGVYNINSISLQGNSTLKVNPPGAAVLNVAGQGGGNVVDFTGGTVVNTTGIANNFHINYAGTGSMSLSGGSNSYEIVYAPNAAVALTGGADLYGAVLGATISDGGGMKFHYDRNTKLAPQSNGNYNLISFREISY